MEKGRPVAFVAATLALAAAALWVWISWCRAPASSWNDLRLAPVLMAVSGAPVYASPGGGVLTTWLYGPAPLWLWSPAALGNTVQSALLLAAATNIAITLAALGLVCIAWPAAPARAEDRLLAFALTILLLPEATFRFLQADNVAVAAGLLANLALTRDTGWKSAWFAALATALALASKQTAVGIAFGQFVWLWRIRGAPAAFTHASRTGICLAALAAVAVGQFGAAALWHRLIVVPSRLPWADDLAQRTRDVLPWILMHWGIPAALLLVLRRRSVDAVPGLGLPLACWLATFPFGVAGVFTTGGSINHFHGLPLLLAPALVTLLPGLRARWRLTGVATAAAALSLLCWKTASADVTPLRPALARVDLAEQVARRYPGQVWLPWAPTVTYFVEHRFDHTEDGIYVSFITGHRVSRAEALAHLPPRFSMMLLPAGGSEWGVARKLAADPSTARDLGPWTLVSWNSMSNGR